MGGIKKRSSWKCLLLVVCIFLQTMAIGFTGVVKVYAAEINPFQTFMIESMSLKYNQRDDLSGYMILNINNEEDVTSEVISKVNSYVPMMSYSDVEQVLTIFAARSNEGKQAITYLILYGLRELQGNVDEFSDISSLFNEVIAGDASDMRGFRFFMTVLYQARLRTGQIIAKNGSPATKIKFGLEGYEKEKQQVSSMIGYLTTLQQAIADYPGVNNFEKLMSFTEQAVNSRPNKEIAAFKVFLRNNGQIYDGDPYPDVPPFTIDARFTIDGSTVTELEAGKELTVNVSVANESGEKKDVLVIVALYNEEDTMENVSYIYKNIPDEGSEDLIAGFRLPLDIAGYTARAFIWEGTDIDTTSMMPLSDIIYIPQP